MIATDSLRSKPLYYPELDGLRFLASLLVFIHHAAKLKTYGFLQPIGLLLAFLHRDGWVGVDLFLCLSAFLFTKLLFVENQAQSDINIRNFYTRRLLRIWPLYYFFIMLMTIKTVSLVGWTGSVAFRSLSLATVTDNITSAILGYNILFATEHLWTISYEEQFYAIIPWFLRHLFRTTRKGRSFLFSRYFVLLH